MYEASRLNLGSMFTSFYLTGKKKDDPVFKNLDINTVIFKLFTKKKENHFRKIQNTVNQWKTTHIKVTYEHTNHQLRLILRTYDYINLRVAPIK